MLFPRLPEYSYSWRSIQIEPLPNSGERITLGAIVQGDDGSLMVAKLVPATKLKSIFGQVFGGRIADALNICVASAESFFSKQALTHDWRPPLDGFLVSETRSSVAVDIEDGLLMAARNSCCLSVSLEAVKEQKSAETEKINPQTWRKEIIEQVILQRKDFKIYFKKAINFSPSGVPLTFGFVSPRYAAHFDAISAVKSGSVRQSALVRAQSKLWQLDRLRDNDQLFQQDKFELVLYRPNTEGEDADSLAEFVKELRYEASRRELEIHTSNSSEEAARHVLECAA